MIRGVPGFLVVVVGRVGVVRAVVRVLVVVVVESLSLRLLVTITNNTTKNATSAPAASKRLMFLFMFAEGATKPAESRGYTGQRLLQAPPT